MNGKYDPEFKNKPDTRLAFILQPKDTSLIPLDLTAKDMDFVFILDIMIGGSTISAHQNKLYIAIPCANRMAVFDMETKTFASIPLVQSVNLANRPSKSVFNQHTLDGLERIYAICATPSRLITSSYVYRDGKGNQYTRIYTYSGYLLGEIVYPYTETIRTVYATDYSLYTLTKTDTTKSLFYPYSIVQQDYLCKKN